MSIFARIIVIDDEEMYFYHRFDSHDVLYCNTTGTWRDGS